MNNDYEVVKWDVNKLVPYQRNPVEHQGNDVTQMASMLLEYGCRPPLLIRSNGEICDGHLRYLAALKLEWSELPVIICDDWTDAQIKAYRISSRKSAQWADFDDELLKLELDDLSEMDFDMDLLGFSDSEMDEMSLENSSQQPSLDDLEKEYGEPKDDDFYPIIKVQATPEGKERFEQLMQKASGDNEYEKFDVLLDAIDESKVL